MNNKKIILHLTDFLMDEQNTIAYIRFGCCAQKSCSMPKLLKML